MSAGHASRPGSGKVGSAILLSLILIALLAPWLANGDPSAISGDALRPPDAAHLFGTDDLGRDLFSGVVHGTRTSLAVGFVAAALSAFVALLVGGAAAMRGGATDQILRTAWVRLLRLGSRNEYRTNGRRRAVA